MSSGLEGPLPAGVADKEKLERGRLSGRMVAEPLLWDSGAQPVRTEFPEGHESAPSELALLSEVLAGSETPAGNGLHSFFVAAPQYPWLAHVDASS